MFDQAMFDKIVYHSRAMTQESRGASGVCAYRAPDGNRCLLGAVIPDELYDRKMEGDTINDVCHERPEVAATIGWSKADAPAYASLQAIHDYYFDSREECLTEWAEAHGFTMPPL